MSSSSTRSLVVFDCDGVLVDTEHLVLDVRIQMLREAGIPIGRDELVERFVGTPHAVFVAELEQRGGRPLTDGWERDYQDRCRQAFERNLAPVPGIAAALDELASVGLRTCVASSGSHDKMALTLGLSGLLPRFEGRIFSGDDVPRGKPFPDLFLHAAEQMGCPAGECVVVEDSAAGVAAGLAAGMDVVAYAGSVTPRARLVQPGVSVIDDMAELPSLILR